MSDPKEMMRRPLFVCHILPALPLNGAENLLLKICRNMNPAEIRTSILLIVDGGPLVADFEALGIPVTVIPKRGRYDLSIIWKIRAFLKQGQFDVVHTHLFTANLWGRLGSSFLGMAVISSMHSIASVEKSVLRKTEQFLDRLLVPLTDSVVCVTLQVMRTMQQVARLPREKLVTIDNGVDIPLDDDSMTKDEARSRLNLSSRIPLLAIIGRFSKPKNHQTFIESLLPVREKFPDLVVLLVGIGELEETIRKKVSILGLAGTVQFLGSRRDISVILKALDLLVIPSLWEGLPIILLEALVSGTPVVATQVGGIPDVVTDGETGLLTTADASALARTMIWALEHPSGMQTMASAALIMSRKHYDIRLTAKRYGELYQSTFQRQTFGKGIRRISRSIVGKVLSRKPRKKDGLPAFLRVLSYHRVAEDLNRDILCVHPFDFFEQMKWLREEGYEILPVEAALDLLKKGTLPAQAVAITFDDGYRDIFEKAFPILARMEIPSMVFPVTGFVQGVGRHPRYLHRGKEVLYLTVDQIRAMKKEGVDFGCHTHSHPWLPRIHLEEATAEIRQSKQLLEEWTSGPIKVFCYPNGAYESEHFHLLQKHGFEAAFSMRPGLNRPSASRWTLRRTEVSGRDSLEDFIHKMWGGLDLWHGLYQGVRKFYR
ncbi:MAG: glycosyltransferase [Leptospirales bacterium]